MVRPAQHIKKERLGLLGFFRPSPTRLGLAQMVEPAHPIKKGVGLLGRCQPNPTQYI